jgi:hypothetical protein
MNIVLSYGLGVDSTALLLRWIEEPASRDFDLSRLLVVTAMTGDEWPRTGELVEEHILPRLRDAGIAYAQVARRGPSNTVGAVVLEAGDSPKELHIEGAYTLHDDLTAAGSVPQTTGKRLCSLKFKGWPIDTYLRDHAPEATRHAFGYERGEAGRAERCASHMPWRLVFGFEAAEQSRARRAQDFDSPARVAEFPLIEWGWDREDCQRYIYEVTGVPDWPKSACVYCPFALTSKAGRERTLQRYAEAPESALKTLMLEWRALCLNPRAGLIAGDRFVELIAERRPDIAARFHQELAVEPHALYRVRRLWRPRREDPEKVANANRDLQVLATGSRDECRRRLHDLGQVSCADGIERVFRVRRRGALPAREDFFVAGPAGARSKALRSFDSWWKEAGRRGSAAAR